MSELLVHGRMVTVRPFCCPCGAALANQSTSGRTLYTLDSKGKPDIIAKERYELLPCGFCGEVVTWHPAKRPIRERLREARPAAALAR